MEIYENKALLIKTRNPDKYSIIPSQVRFDEDTLAIRWGLDEARILRNLGVRNVPSPIYKKYEWPCRYPSVFAHQKETASFLTMNRRAFVLSEPGCVDSETEYLSPTGWKRIADYQEGPVAQYHPEEGNIEFVKPDEFVKLPCDTMVRVKTKYGVDQLLSPEHRMLIHSNAGYKKWCVMSAAEVLAAHDDNHAKLRRAKGGSAIVSFSHMAIPSAFSTPGGAGLPITDAPLRVQIAVIADGHFPNKSTSCVVRLKRQRKVVRLRSLLNAAKIEYKERLQNTPTAQGFHVFSFKAPWRVKEFDHRFWSCSSAQLAIIADEVVYWDGTVRRGNKGNSFASTVKASADFVQYAWNAQGLTARVYTERRKHYKNGAIYTVQARGTTRGGKYGLLTLRNRAAPTVTTALSTDGFKYCFRVPSTFLLFRRNGCVFASGNTAKTLSALWAADYLMRLGEVRRVLVVCPLSIMQTAWMADIGRSIIHRTAIVCHHNDSERRKEMIRKDYEIVILNYDGIPLVADDIIKDGRFDLIIADEATALKTATTRRWKYFAKLLRPDMFLWLMTGTPAAQSPLDAYGLAKLVNPNGVPKFFTAWRDLTMNKITTFKWLPKHNATELVHKVMQPAIRFTKAECLDLPPVLTETRHVDMTPQQTKYYKILKEQAIIQAAGEEISAPTKAQLVGKLLQISCGAAYSENHETVQFDCSSRMRELVDILEQTDRKVLIFALFRSSIEYIVAHLQKEGYDVGEIHGGINQNQRSKVIDRFQNTSTPKVLVMQPQASAHGITLTAADTVVFYGPLMSVEQYVQCCARADRQGQTADKVTVIHLQSSPIEAKMFDALAGKVSDHRLLTDMFDDEIKELTSATKKYKV